MRATYAMVGVACVLAGIVGSVTIAAPVPANRSGLTVHEWGTFTSFSGSDGVPQKFYPNGAGDLPKFVYSSQRFVKVGQEGTVSLETPVLYFYADRPMTAIVKAEFPAGVFTEWFPQAARPQEKALNWADVRIRSSETGTPPTAPGPPRYYAARETDADPITVVTKDAAKETREHEQFLFYRGVGDPKTPLIVFANGANSFTLQTTGAAPISAAFLVEVKAGRLRYRPIEPIAAGAAVKSTLPAEWSNAEALKAALVPKLIQAGLYEKEARAMVKTWEPDWFREEGTRVLYLLPANWTDRTIPLKVTPTPDRIVRVMVGRHDVLTPERELELDALMSRIQGAEGADRDAALGEFQKLGRFTSPAADQARKRLAVRK